jgi:enoyl-CoA hydratase/carnithine racemase
MTASTSVAPAELFTRENDNGVVTLTLSTPQSLNALSVAMIEALIAELEAIAGDDWSRVVVLAGVGPALSASHDLQEM